MIRAYFSVFAVFILSIFQTFGTEIEITFKQSTEKEISLQIQEYINTVEYETIFSVPCKPGKVNFRVSLTTPKFVYFTTPNSSFEVLIEPDSSYFFEYDLNNLSWTNFGSAGSKNQLRWKAAQLISGLQFYLSDSATYVQHFKSIFQDSLYHELKKRGINENFDRDAFNLFLNHVQSRKLFSIDLSKKNDLTAFLNKLAELEKLNLDLNSKTGFLSLRMYHLGNSNQLFKSDLTSSLSFAHLFKNASDWISGLNIPEKNKSFLLGDFIQFYIILPFKFDDETSSFLQSFIRNNPSSRHFNFIYNKLIKRGDSSSNKKFDPYLTDTYSMPFSLKNIEEKIIYVDFWATWCKPCLEENKFINQLEERFSGKVLFLRVSIDEDKKKWMSSHSRLNIDTSNSYILEGEDRKRWFDELELQAIPKFLVLDRIGNIIDSSPHRPSNPELINQLSSLFNNLK